MRAEGFLPATAAPWRRCLRLVVHGQVRLDFTPVSDEAAEVGVRHIDDDLPELDGAGRLIDLDAALAENWRDRQLVVLEPGQRLDPAILDDDKIPAPIFDRGIQRAGVNSGFHLSREPFTFPRRLTVFFQHRERRGTILSEAGG